MALYLVSLKYFSPHTTPEDGTANAADIADLTPEQLIVTGWLQLTDQLPMNRFPPTPVPPAPMAGTLALRPIAVVEQVPTHSCSPDPNGRDPSPNS
jgi:hypothetical protein